MPLYVFSGDRLLCAYLRCSNIDPALHSRAILRLLVNRLRTKWPKVKITFRADAGFCRWKLLKYCDNHDIGYVVGLARNEVLIVGDGAYGYLLCLGADEALEPECKCANFCWSNRIVDLNDRGALAQLLNGLKCASCSMLCR